MFGLGKKKESRRWNGKYAIRKTTRNDGAVQYETVWRYTDYGGTAYWGAIERHDTCKEAEAYIETLWNEDTAKTEIITQCEECE